MRPRAARPRERDRPPRSGGTPPVGVVDVVDRDADGELLVRRIGGDGEPNVRLAPGASPAAGAPGVGDRLLVRFSRSENGELEARLIKRLGQGGQRILGVVRKRAREVAVEPVDRRSRHGLRLSAADGTKVEDGDLVLAKGGAAEAPIRQRGAGSVRQPTQYGQLIEVIGREDDPRAASLIAIHSHGVPMGFSDAAESEAHAARVVELGGRVDLRRLPLLTIDPPDARDHDDAVFAEPDADPVNPGGWIVWVAIADVAAYVAPGSALDVEAREKGNSVYFPDRVEPMLPEALSAGLCSLLEGEDRPCVAVRMVFGADGRRRGHRFCRALMRSVAKLSYEEAQAAIDGPAAAMSVEPVPPAFSRDLGLDGALPAGSRPYDGRSLLECVLRPLWAASAALAAGRERRSPLDISSAERRIELDADGRVVAIRPRAILPAHGLIEEMMIQANVCAAETLESRRLALVYRVHEPPSEAKLLALADFLRTLEISWSKGETVRTERFNRLLRQTRDGPHAEIVNEVVLRTQSQAIYSTENVGHFGLNLDRYTHFTSPIRRYADLLVHRALIAALEGDGIEARGKAAPAPDLALAATAEHITMTERRAMAAERDAGDRYVAAFLRDQTGAVFAGRITGVTRFGLFVRLAETGADGLAPISSLGDDYFIHDEVAHSLIGQRSGARWRLGRRVEVRLREATPVTGGLLLEMLSDPERATPIRRGRRSH